MQNERTHIEATGKSGVRYIVEHTGLNRHARRKLEKLIRQAQKRAGKRRG